MTSEEVTPEEPACRLHGPGTDPARLVGRRLVGVVTARHRFEGVLGDDPVDVWLVDDRGESTLVTAGSDWCLVVEASPPGEDYDTGEHGSVEVRPGADATPFARHVGEEFLAVREEHHPLTGRTALEVGFASGAVRCWSWGGDLRLGAVEQP